MPNEPTTRQKIADTLHAAGVPAEEMNDAVMGVLALLDREEPEPRFVRTDEVHCDACAAKLPKDPALADALREARAGRKVLLTVRSSSRVRHVFDKLHAYCRDGAKIAHAAACTRIDWPAEAGGGWLEIYGGGPGNAPVADLRIDLDQQPRAHHAPHRVEDVVRYADIPADQVPDSVEGVLRLLAAAPTIDGDRAPQHAAAASWAAAERRFVKVRLDTVMLGTLLGLEDSAMVVDAYVERDPVCLKVVIAHPDADPVPRDAEVPYATVHGEKITLEAQRHWIEVRP